MSDQPDTYDAEAIIAQSIANRGDMFAEFQLFMRAQPKAAALNQRVAGYVHQYKNQSTPQQILEAVSCVIPMTGSATMPIGVRAMRLAGLI